MRIQSGSIVVPNSKCINNCKFCVSNMREDKYEDMISGRNLYFNRYLEDYIKRLEYMDDRGVDTLMITGDTEPQQNWRFLRMFAMMNRMTKNPFKKIELQTTGTMINDDYLYFLRHTVQVSTISVSISSFDNDRNAYINQTPDKWKVDIKYLCSRIKQYRFNLRISINLTNDFIDYTPAEIFEYCQDELGADQITLRQLYTSGEGTPQDKWIEENALPDNKLKLIKTHIKTFGNEMEKLDFGLTRYSVHGMSIVVDGDCMSTEAQKDLKYVILRPNCKIYSKWDDPASLIF